MSAELLERIRQNVPSLLRELPVWLLWKSVPGEPGEKPKKIPYYATGKVRTGTTDTLEDRAQLVDFETAARALSGPRARFDYAGLGVALGEVPGEEIQLAGIDFDDCYNASGELDERATQVLLAAQSYSERSPSGVGLKVFGTGNVGTVKKDAAGLEIYCAGRFFTVTGEALNHAGLADLADAAPLARKLFLANGADDAPAGSANQQGGGGSYVLKGGRNNFLSREAFRLRKHGSTPEQLAYVLAAMNQAWCRPPLPEAEVQQIAHGKAGIAADDTDTVSTFPLLWLKELEQVKPRPQIVKGLLVAGSLFLVYGEANSGKSFWLLDLALNVAGGTPWRGRRTRRGLVIYIAGESADSIGERVAAYLKEHREVSPGLPFAVIREPVDLLDAESAEKLIRTIRAAESECGEKATLIVIDTFARSIAGGNENDAQDVGRAVRAADRIRIATGACVGFIHHAGKDTSKGARGSSALRAAADTEILTEGQTGTRTVAVKKQRDLPAGGRFAFELRQVILGTEEDGEAVTSCVVIEAEAPESPAVTRIKGANRVKLFAALKEWRSANPGKEIISSLELVRVAKAQGLATNRKSEAVAGLEMDGVLITTVGGHRIVLEGFCT